MMRQHGVTCAVLSILVVSAVCRTVDAQQLEAEDAYTRCVPTESLRADYKFDPTSILYFRSGASVSPVDIGRVNATGKYSAANFIAVRRDPPSGPIKDINGAVRKTFQLVSPKHGRCLAPQIGASSFETRQVELVSCSNAGAETYWVSNTSGVMDKLEEAKRSLYTNGVIQAEAWNVYGLFFYTVRAAERKELSTDKNVAAFHWRQGTLRVADSRLVVGGLSGGRAHWFCSGPSFASTRPAETFVSRTGSPWGGTETVSPLTTNFMMFDAVSSALNLGTYAALHTGEGATAAAKQILDRANARWPNSQDSEVRSYFYFFASQAYTTQPGTWLDDAEAAALAMASVTKFFREDAFRNIEATGNELLEAIGEEQLADFQVRAAAAHGRFLALVRTSPVGLPIEHGVTRKTESMIHRALLAAPLHGDEMAENHRFWGPTAGYQSSAVVQARLQGDYSNSEAVKLFSGNIRASLQFASMQGNLYNFFEGSYIDKNATLRFSIGGAISAEKWKMISSGLSRNAKIKLLQFLWDPYRRRDADGNEIPNEWVPELEGFVHFLCTGLISKTTCKVVGFNIGFVQDTTLWKTPTQALIDKVKEVVTNTCWNWVTTHAADYVSRVPGATITHQQFIGAFRAVAQGTQLALSALHLRENALALYHMLSLQSRAVEVLQPMELLEIAENHPTVQEMVRAVTEDRVQEIIPWHKQAFHRLATTSVFAERGIQVSYVVRQGKVAEGYFHYTPYGVFAQSSATGGIQFKEGQVKIGGQLRTQVSAAVSLIFPLGMHADKFSDPIVSDVIGRALVAGSGGE
jgi:hypothetical protein